MKDSAGEARHTGESNLGERIRRYRLKAGLNVKSLAERAGVTPGFLSQVEHNRVAPSIDTLRSMAKAMDIPVFYLMLDDDVPSQLVRADERPTVTIPGRRLEYQMLTSNRESKFGVMIGRLGPGESSGDALNSHSGEECIIVQRGKIVVEMPHESHEMSEGGSLYFDSTVPHRVRNATSEPAEFMLVLSPPRF